MVLNKNDSTWDRRRCIRRRSQFLMKDEFSTMYVLLETPIKDESESIKQIIGHTVSKLRRQIGEIVDEDSG